MPLARVKLRAPGAPEDPRRLERDLCCGIQAGDAMEEQGLVFEDLGQQPNLRDKIVADAGCDAKRSYGAYQARLRCEPQ